MSMKLPLGEIIANLESRIVFHRDQAAVHARQEEEHRAQRVFHEAELKKVTEHCEALKAVAGPAAELALPAAPTPPPEAGPPPALHVMIKQIVEAHPDGEPFGQTSLTAEIARRYPAALEKKVDPRSVSATLRRLLARRRIHLVREGRPCHEALYAKGAGTP